MVVHRGKHLRRYYLIWHNYFTCDIALVLQLFLNGCANTCVASILAILRAIAQAKIKYDWE